MGIIVATISKRKRQDGGYSYQAIVRKKGYPSTSRTFRLRKDAQQWAIELETDILRGNLSQGSQIYSLGELISRYENDRLPRLRSRRCRHRHLAWWLNKLGDTKLSRLTRPLIKGHLRELSKSLNRSGATVNRYRASLQALLSYAVTELEWIPANPLQGMPKEPEARGRIRFLADDERKRLLAACSENGDLYLIVLIALTTGARESEILHLRWSDIDLRQATARIGDTKNDEPRVLPLASTVLAVLRKRPHGIGASDWLFRSPKTGTEPQAFPRKAWNRCLVAAGIKDFRFHDLRHTAASYLAQNGVSTRQLADMLGHKTLAMVQRYSHLTVDSRRSLVDMLDKKVLEQ